MENTCLSNRQLNSHRRREHLGWCCVKDYIGEFFGPALKEFLINTTDLLNHVIDNTASTVSVAKNGNFTLNSE